MDCLLNTVNMSTTHGRNYLNYIFILILHVMDCVCVSLTMVKFGLILGPNVLEARVLSGKM